MIITRFALIPGFLLTLTGCMTNATVELTKAPFDATTDLTGGTSGATREFLDPTTEFISSTTPGYVEATSPKLAESYTSGDVSRAQAAQSDKPTRNNVIFFIIRPCIFLSS